MISFLDHNWDSWAGWDWFSLLMAAGCWWWFVSFPVMNKMRGAWVYVSISAGPPNPFKLVAVELSFVMFSCRILVIFWLRDWAGPGSLLWCQQPSLWMNIFNQRMRGPKFGQAHVLLRFYCQIRIRMKYKTKRYTKCKCQLQDNFRRLKMCCTGLYCDFDSENLPAG